jgi:hypothetical protein
MCPCSGSQRAFRSPSSAPPGAVLTAPCPGGQVRWAALGLSRSAKGGAFAAALLALLGASGWGTRGATVLLGALVVRCNLKPSEARAAASKQCAMCCGTQHNHRNLSWHVARCLACCWKPIAVGVCMAPCRKMRAVCRRWTRSARARSRWCCPPGSARGGCRTSCAAGPRCACRRWASCTSADSLCRAGWAGLFCVIP